MPDITIPVSAQFPHPPIQTLSVSSIAGGTYTAGDYTFTRPLVVAGITVVPVSAFGFQWSVTLEDPTDGLVLGLVTRYEQRTCQIVVHYKSLDGQVFNGVVVDNHLDSGYILFDTFPEDVQVRVDIGYGLTFDWLILL